MSPAIRRFTVVVAMPAVKAVGMLDKVQATIFIEGETLTKAFEEWEKREGFESCYMVAAFAVMKHKWPIRGFVYHQGWFWACNPDGTREKLYPHAKRWTLTDEQRAKEYENVEPS